MAVDIISAQKLRELLNYDPETGIFTWRIVASTRAKIDDIAGCISTTGYRLIGIDRVLYRAHRLAWLYVYGEWPLKIIDHINGVRTDNRIENLRDVSSQANSHNRHELNITNTSGVAGVIRNKRTKKWTAYIVVNNKRHHIGYFDTLDAAAEARAESKQRLHIGVVRH